MAHVCYEQFFQYFQFGEVHWLGNQFYEQLRDESHTIGRDGMFTITEKWLEYRWGGPGRSLDSKKVEEELIAQTSAKADLDMGDSAFTFPQIVHFVFHYQHFHLMKEKTSGFTKGDIDRYDETFRRHCCNLPGEKVAAKAAELWKILAELGFDFPTVTDQEYIIELVKNADVDKSGTIDFEELLSLLRTIIDDQKVRARMREHELIMKSKMNYEECDQWIEVFQACAGDQPSIRLPDVKTLFDGLQLKWGQDGSKKLMEWLRVVDEDSNGEIDFGEFCCLVQKMWDDNFGEIKSKVGDALAQAKSMEVAPPNPADPTSPPASRRRASWIEVVSDKVEEELDPDAPKYQGFLQTLKAALGET